MNCKEAQKGRSQGGENIIKNQTELVSADPHPRGSGFCVLDQEAGSNFKC